MPNENLRILDHNKSLLPPARRLRTTIRPYFVVPRLAPGLLDPAPALQHTRLPRPPAVPTCIHPRGLQHHSHHRPAAFASAEQDAPCCVSCETKIIATFSPESTCMCQANTERVQSHALSVLPFMSIRGRPCSSPTLSSQAKHFPREEPRAGLPATGAIFGCDNNTSSHRASSTKNFLSHRVAVHMLCEVETARG